VKVSGLWLEGVTKFLQVGGLTSADGYRFVLGDSICGAPATQTRLPFWGHRTRYVFPCLRSETWDPQFGATHLPSDISRDGVVEAQDANGKLFGFDRAQALSLNLAAEIAEAAQRFGPSDHRQRKLHTVAGRLTGSEREESWEIDLRRPATQNQRLGGKTSHATGKHNVRTASIGQPATRTAEEGYGTRTYRPLKAKERLCSRSEASICNLINSEHSSTNDAQEC
jgi:hypothetical protein